MELLSYRRRSTSIPEEIPAYKNGIQMETLGEKATEAAIVTNAPGGGVFEKQPVPDPEIGQPGNPSPTGDSTKDPLFDSMSHVGAGYSTFYPSYRIGPLCVIMCLGWGMSAPLWVELLKNKVCLEDLEYAANVCHHISEDENKLAGDAVRSKTADLQMFDILISSVPTVIYSVLVGAWSDRIGRKLPMMLPLIGLVLCVTYIAVMGQFSRGAGILLVASALGSIFGGWTIFTMAVYSYIGDYSSSKNRSMNFVIVECLMAIFSSAGSYLGGYLNQELGTFYPYYIIAGCYTLTILYVIIFIHDLPKEKNSENPTGFAGLFTLDNIRDSIRLLKKPRLKDTRLHIWVVFLALTVFNLVLSGDGAIMQLFAEFKPIKWDLVTYTQWSAITSFLNSSLSMFLMLVMRKFLHINDTLIGFLACLSALLAYFAYGIAWEGWMLYLGAFLGVLKVLMYVSIRSLMSTLVEPDEIGKSMSLISSMQAITPIFGAVIYTNLFARTSHFWPGLCFIAAAFTLVPVVGAMGYVDIVRRRDVYKDD